MLDISPGGAFISADEPPPLDHRVWIRLEQPATTPWVGGRVVRVDEAGRVGIAFLDPCTRDVFEAAVQGISFGHILGGSALRPD